GISSPTGRSRPACAPRAAAPCPSRALCPSNGSPCSTIDFPEDNVLRADDRDHIGQHVAGAHLLERRQVRETRRAALPPVRLVGTIGDEVDAKLPLGRLDCRVRLAFGYFVAFREELEVVDERFHVILHLLA